jgi:hypothetical protein
LIQKGARETFQHSFFKIEGTRFFDGQSLVGWRITSTDLATHHEREYWVQDRNICLVDFRIAKPWTHKTPFIVGRRVTRIRVEEKEAIFRAIVHW